MESSGKAFVKVSLKNEIKELLKTANLSTDIVSIETGLKGGNNRTYRIETTEGVYAVKQYFKEKCDLRDRLGTEFAFLQYAEHIIPQSIPKPYAKNSDLGLALYSYIDGKQLASHDITDKEVQEAINFFVALNESKHQGMSLPTASEACFSLAAHFNLVGERIQKLKNISIQTDEDKTGIKLILELEEYWQKLLTEMKSKKFDLTLSLNDAERCISPSDFGFHNTLKRKDGSLCFLDFEYAGWDDPAKMTGDFFSQLAIPVPQKYFDHFVNAVMAPFTNAENLIQRAYILRTVYQIKWCCIALNIFIPDNLKRRQFANPDLDVTQLKRAQLEKTRYLIEKLEVIHG